MENLKYVASTLLEKELDDLLDSVKQGHSFSTRSMWMRVGVEGRYRTITNGDGTKTFVAEINNSQSDKDKIKMERAFLCIAIYNECEYIQYINSVFTDDVTPVKLVYTDEIKKILAGKKKPILGLRKGVWKAVGKGAAEGVAVGVIAFGLIYGITKLLK